eukprot:7639528-Pyramimonas_sp.AAC.1
MDLVKVWCTYRGLTLCETPEEMAAASTPACWFPPGRYTRYPQSNSSLISDAEELLAIYTLGRARGSCAHFSRAPFGP